MKPQLRVISGSRAGETFVFSSNYIAVGRHPESDLQFDPHLELDVSGRHAAIVQQGSRWILRDLGSRNGTLVNGHRINADMKLDDTDQIRFGPGGPTVEFRLVADAIPDTAPRPAIDASEAPRGSIASPPRPSGAVPPSASTSQRVQLEVARQTRRLRQITGAAVVLLAAVGGGFWFLSREQRLARDREVAALQAQVDSVLRDAAATVAALQGEMADLAAALDSSQADVQGLRGQLARARASGNEAQIETLSTQLETALTALAVRQLAAGIDFERITDSNRRAVAMVFVDFGNRRVETGTAFAVRRDGIMLTNRHVVIDRQTGRRAGRIVIRFAGSRQSFRGVILAVGEGEDVDLAVLRVQVGSEVQTVQGFNDRADTVAVGAPVAVIGFPGGMQSPQLERADGTYAAASLTAGTVSKNLPNLIQINGYGSPGASGSPVFDANGQVIAVLFGGESGSGGRIVFAVPISFATELLSRLQ